MANRDHKSNWTLTVIRTAITVGLLAIAVGVGGLLYGANRKVEAIDCLTGASPPSDWVFDRHGSAQVREIVGHRGTLMFLDRPRYLSYHDVFTEEHADALLVLQTLERVWIRHAFGLDDPPAPHVTRLHTAMSHCDIICWRSDGTRNWHWDWDESEWMEVPSLEHAQSEL